MWAPIRKMSARPMRLRRTSTTAAFGKRRDPLPLPRPSKAPVIWITRSTKGASKSAETTTPRTLLWTTEWRLSAASGRRKESNRPLRHLPQPLPLLQLLQNSDPGFLTISSESVEHFNDRQAFEPACLIFVHLQGGVAP